MLMAFGCGNDPGPTAPTINPMRRGVGQLANTRWRSIPKNRISSAIENTFIMRFICAWRVRFEQRNLLSVSPSANSNLIHTAIWIIQCHLWYRKRITLPTGMRFQYRAVWCRRITTTKNKYNSCSGPEECAVIFPTANWIYDSRRKLCLRTVRLTVDRTYSASEIYSRALSKQQKYRNMKRWKQNTHDIWPRMLSACRQNRNLNQNGTKTTNACLRNVCVCATAMCNWTNDKPKV